MLKAILCLIACVALLFPAVPQAQTPAHQRTWTEEKCMRYRDAWIGVQQRWGTDGLSAGFIQQHKSFVEGGCTGERNICARSAKEIEIANVLTIRAMNAGMASTFLPFACRN